MFHSPASAFAVGRYRCCIHRLRPPANGGEAQPITKARFTATFFNDIEPVVGGDGSEDGSRLYWSENFVLKSIRLSDNDATYQTHARIEPSTRIAPSPDQRWVAVESNWNVFVMPMRAAAGNGARDSFPRLNLTDSPLAPGVQQVTLEGGIEPSWSEDGVWLRWQWTNQACQMRIADLQASRSGGGPAPVPQCRTMRLQVPQHVAMGSVLLRGARVITMAASGVKRVPKGDGGVTVSTDPGVLESADVLVTNRRIVAIGPRGTVSAPANAKVMDMSGTTLMPGIIDLHGDSYTSQRRFPDGPSWDVSAVLAYGITTVRRPNARVHEQFRQSENTALGAELGPRSFNAPILQSHRFRTRDDARHAARKFKSLGSVALKEYGEGRPAGRLGTIWTSQEGARVGLNVTGHWTDGHMQDGFSGWEHTNPLAQQQMPIYSDWVEFLGRSGATNTPTIGPLTRGPAGDEAYAECMDFTTAKARRVIGERWREWHEKTKGACRPLTLNERATRAVRGICDVLHAGGNVAVGSHGPAMMGIVNSQWEMWRMVQGGCTVADALRIGTLNGAIGLGMAKDLGSIEVGKIADILVLNANPLEDIRNTLSIRYVMKDGIIYNGDTLEQVWPDTKR